MICKHTPYCGKGHLVLIFWIDGHLIVSRESIQKIICFMACHSLEHMFSKWQGIMIPNDCCINLFEVNAYSYLNILLHYNHDGWYPLFMLNFVYESYIEKFIDLFLSYRLILGIHVIRSLLQYLRIISYGNCVFHHFWWHTLHVLVRPSKTILVFL